MIKMFTAISNGKEIARPCDDVWKPFKFVCGRQILRNHDKLDFTNNTQFQGTLHVEDEDCSNGSLDILGKCDLRAQRLTKRTKTQSLPKTAYSYTHMKKFGIYSELVMRRCVPLLYLLITVILHEYSYPSVARNHNDRCPYQEHTAPDQDGGGASHDISPAHASFS